MQINFHRLLWSYDHLPRVPIFLAMTLCVCVCVCVYIYIYIYIYIYRTVICICCIYTVHTGKCMVGQTIQYDRLEKIQHLESENTLNQKNPVQFFYNNSMLSLPRLTMTSTVSIIKAMSQTVLDACSLNGLWRPDCWTFMYSITSNSSVDKEC